MKLGRNEIMAAGASGALLLLSASPVFAQIPTVAIQPPKSIGAINTDVNTLIAFIINAIIVVGIVLSLIFLLWGGIRWITSGGDKAKVDTARGTIVAAIVGLIIVILAWVIINAVLGVLGAGSLTGGFAIPSLKSTSTP